MDDHLLSKIAKLEKKTLFGRLLEFENSTWPIKE
jgi:hypothetical protein